MSDKQEKQLRFTVSFRKSVTEEIKLYNWLKNKNKITPIAVTIKEILYKAMEEEETNK